MQPPEKVLPEQEWQKSAFLLLQLQVSQLGGSRRPVRKYSLKMPSSNELRLHALH